MHVCVCVTKLCVCDKVSVCVCDKVRVCVCARVRDKLVCVRHVCHRDVCERFWVTKLCVCDKVCCVCVTHTETHAIEICVKDCL